MEPCVRRKKKGQSGRPTSWCRNRRSCPYRWNPCDTTSNSASPTARPTSSRALRRKNRTAASSTAAACCTRCSRP
ncbi:hypothetical protein EVA_19449 [gut metagenome]|uniref:Uncharacterized protein n=1 Tax=gut metagenome TaxID=749906 RepID=J9FS95_9ZZZZ